MILILSEQSENRWYIIPKKMYYQFIVSLPFLLRIANNTHSLSKMESTNYKSLITV